MNEPPRTATVLVVDDTAADRAFSSHALADAGLRVIEAASGEEALSRLAERPALVLVDLDLPGIGGFELCRRIKAHPEAQAMMLLATSTSVTAGEDGIASLEHGADGYLAQPFTSGELVAQVRALLRLHRAEAAARESTSELEQFARIAAHDLHEPLRMVTSYLQLFDRKNHERLDEKSRGYLAFAIDGAQRMGAMINDLLAYSRLDAARMRIALVDVKRVLGDALTNLEATVHDRGAYITSGPMPTLQADHVRLVQLFENLLGNAIKFCAETPPVVDVRAEEREREWVFSVTDNGIGIDEADQGRIFNLFERLHSRAEYPGTGLGLAVSRRIVELHDGRIWVSSTPGKGSTFSFSIAKHAAPAGDQAHVAGAIPA